MTIPQHLPESYEQLRARLGDSVRGLFAPEGDSWTCIEGTYPDRIIATVHADGPGPDSTATYSIPYRLTGGSITLGTPQPVELATIVVPEGPGEHRAATSVEDVDARIVQPTVEALTDATARINATTADPEHLEEVRATVRSLVTALSSKGLNVDEEDEEPPAAPSAAGPTGMDLWDSYAFEDDEDDEDEPADDTEEEAPEPEDTVRLDAEEVKEALAAMRT